MGARSVVKAAFEAKTSIDRRDFGLKWNQALETGGVRLAGLHRG